MIVVGAVVALIGGVVFLWFLLSALKTVFPRHQQQQYTAVGYQSYQDSKTSLQSGAPVKEKKGLSTWTSIATIVSAILAIVGTVVSIYFGVKHK